MTRTEISKDKKLFDLVTKQDKIVKEYTKTKEYKLLQKAQKDIDTMNDEIKTHQVAIQALQSKAADLTTTKEIKAAMEVDGKYMNRVQDAKEQIVKYITTLPVGEFEEITTYQLKPKSVELKVVDVVEEAKAKFLEKKTKKS